MTGHFAKTVVEAPASGKLVAGIEPVSLPSRCFCVGSNYRRR